MRHSTDRNARSLAFRALRSALLAVASVWALWLVAAQAFLWTPLLRALINSHAPKIRLEYRFAWSVIPGVVHVRGFVLTGQDRAVEWRLALDEVRTFIALGQLPSRVFHAQHLRARGVAFALRRRLYPKEVTPSRVRGLPLIDGLPPIPRREEGPEDDLPDFRYRLFSVWLEDVAAADVRQIWIDSWRMDGAAELAGAFYLKPLRDLLVAPGEARVQRASVSGLGLPVADGVQGTLHVSIDRLDPRKLTLERFFRPVNADVDLRGRVIDPEALGATGGTGPAEVHAQVRRGRLERGAIALDLEGPAWRGLRADRAQLRADATPDVRIEATATAASMPAVATRAERVRAQLSGDSFDLGRPALPPLAAVDVEGGAIESARLLAARLLHDRRVESGRGAFAAHLEGALRRLNGWARVSLRGIQVAAKGLRVRGRALVHARIRNLDPDHGADLTGTQVSIERGRLVPDMEIGPGWWGVARLRQAQVRFRPLRLDADLDARCRDARPIVGVYAHVADLPDFLNSLFGMDGLVVYGSVHAGRGWFSVPEVSAEGNDASVRATLRQDEAGRRGAVLLTAHGISIALDLDRMMSARRRWAAGPRLAGDDDRAWFARPFCATQSRVRANPAPLDARREALRGNRLPERCGHAPCDASGTQAALRRTDRGRQQLPALPCAARAWGRHPRPAPARVAAESQQHLLAAHDWQLEHERGVRGGGRRRAFRRQGRHL